MWGFFIIGMVDKVGIYMYIYQKTKTYEKTKIIISDAIKRIIF